MRSGKALPSLHHICDGIGVVREKFEKLPHVFVDSRRGDPVDAPLTPNLNAYRAILFWRDWRNLLVHRSGMVNEWFYREYQPFWRDFKQSFPYIRDFEKGKRLPLDDGSFRALTTTHYRAARSLMEVLMEASSQRRGHILAPGPPAQDPYNVPPEKLPPRPPPLLMQGDHDLSYKWMSDVGFRYQTRSMLTSSMKNKTKVDLERSSC
jgi:hypothetical protein